MAREKVTAALSVLLLCAAAAFLFPGCDSSSTGAGEDFNVTSSMVAGHTHKVRMTMDELANQPAAGVTYTSTTDAGHAHAISLTQAELATIDGGGVVTVTSTSNAGHTHTWTIRKP